MVSQLSLTCLILLAEFLELDHMKFNMSLFTLQYRGKVEVQYYSNFARSQKIKVVMLRYYTVSILISHYFKLKLAGSVQMLLFLVLRSISKQKQPPEVFCKKKSSQKFRKIHRKTLHQSFFFNQVPGLRTLLKKKLRHRFFPVNFTKLL